MIFNHKVKYSGIYYDAGVDVPIEEDEIKSEIPSEKKADEKPVAKKYTRNDLVEKTAKEIKAIASDMGIKITKVVKADIIVEFLSQQ